MYSYSVSASDSDSDSDSDDSSSGKKLSMNRFVSVNKKKITPYTITYIYL